MCCSYILFNFLIFFIFLYSYTLLLVYLVLQNAYHYYFYRCCLLLISLFACCIRNLHTLHDGWYHFVDLIHSRRESLGSYTKASCLVWPYGAAGGGCLTSVCRRIASYRHVLNSYDLVQLSATTKLKNCFGNTVVWVILTLWFQRNIVGIGIQGVGGAGKEATFRATAQRSEGSWDTFDNFPLVIVRAQIAWCERHWGGNFEWQRVSPNIYFDWALRHYHVRHKII